jgi:succinoglycan biosynthesis transport protein ExoP
MHEAVDVMHEVSDADTEALDWRKYLSVARRRMWYFLVSFFLVWAAVWGASWIIQPVYRSGTLILVEQPAVPPQYVIPNIASNLQDRLQSITQQILSRTRLLHIIQAHNLYANERRRMTTDDLVEHMRNDITIELGHSSDRDELTSFNVYYSSHDPHIAQQVTAELTDLFITENLEARQQQSEVTTKFLETQLDQAREALARQDDQVRRYKDKYAGELPTQLQSNQQILSGLQNQLQVEESALNQANQQNVYLQSLLQQQYRAAQLLQKGETLTDLPALDAELDRLKKQLTELRSRYTDLHPDVRSLKEQIARTEHIRQQLAKELSANPTEEGKEKNGNQTALIDGRDAALIGQLKSQLKANQIEISNRETAIQQLETKLGEYQSRLNRAPIREEQLADLTRGYEQSRANYDSLLKKKNDSELATSLELEQKSEHFRILDPASLPTKPYFPNRRKMGAIALLAGFVIGIVAVVVAEFLDGRIYDQKEIWQLTGVNVIGEIPPIVLESEKGTQRRQLWARWVTASIVVATTLLGSGVSYLRG